MSKITYESDLEKILEDLSLKPRRLDHSIRWSIKAVWTDPVASQLEGWIIKPKDSKGYEIFIPCGSSSDTVIRMCWKLVGQMVLNTLMESSKYQETNLVDVLTNVAETSIPGVGI